MANHPLNLGIRFLLELSALAIAGIWGWQRGDGWTQPALAIGIPLLIALLWGTFRVPDDPGKAPVAIPGALRLVLECAVFGFAVWAVFDLGAVVPSYLLGILILLHYLVSYERVLWLIRHP